MNPRVAAAEAEEISSNRGRMLMLMGLFYVFQQFIYLSDPDGPLSPVKAICWGILTLAMLFLLMTRGQLLSPPEVRERLEDEFTHANRAKGLAAGFVAAVLAAITCFYVSLFEPLAVRTAVHVIVSAGLAVAMIRFGWLEHRANADE